jgi:hypothetical protein
LRIESNRQIRNTRLYGRKLGEIDVISGSSNIFFVTVHGKAGHGIGGVLPVSNYGLS